MDARCNTQAQQQRADIVRKTTTAGREAHRVPTPLCALAHRDGPVGCPKMLQEHGDLAIGQREDSAGQLLLVRALSEDAEILEPLADSDRGPAIANPPRPD